MREKIALAVGTIRKKFHLTEFDADVVAGVLITVLAPDYGALDRDAIIWIAVANLLKGSRDGTRHGHSADGLNELAHAIYELYKALKEG